MLKNTFKGVGILLFSCYFEADLQFSYEAVIFVLLLRTLLKWLRYIRALNALKGF